MADTPLPSPELLRQLLTYDADSGLLYWRARPAEMFSSGRACRSWNTRFTGREAFTAVSDGYKRGYILGHACRSHRVAYTLTHGRWPTAEIDHINGQRSDNRLENLREVSSSENSRNRAVGKDNISGVMGVCWNKFTNKWQVDICQKYVGLFASFNEAVVARKAAEVKLGYHPNNGRAA